MTLEYYLDEDDILIQQLFIASQSDRIKKTRQKNRLYLSIAFAVISPVFFNQENYFLGVYFLALGLIWYLVYPFWERRKYNKHYRSYIKEHFSNLIGRNSTLELTDDYILANCDGNESKILIKEISQISEIPALFNISLKTGHHIALPKNKIQNIDLLRFRLKELAAKLNVNYTVHEKWEWK